MKMQSRVLMVAAAIVGVVLIVVSAESGPPATPTSPAATPGAAGPVDPDAPLPPDHPPLDGATGAPAATTMSGVIQEVIPASRYVYLRIEDPGGNGETLWIATGAVDVEEGDEIAFGDGTLMTDFYSQSLDRTFDRILFVTAIQPVS